MTIAISKERLILIRETLRPVALAIDRYDAMFPGRKNDWKPAGTLDISVGDLRAMKSLLEELEKL